MSIIKNLTVAGIMMAAIGANADAVCFRFDDNQSVE
jgi:hypothetical protein